VLANCEAKMGPAAHLLVNETSLSSTSNEHGQADHGAVCGKELVSIERGKCYHKTSSLLGVHIMCIYICGIMCYIILPRLIASTPPPIRGVGGTWALAHFIMTLKKMPKSGKHWEILGKYHS
jgi:hypothetical protein